MILLNTPRNVKILRHSNKNGIKFFKLVSNFTGKEVNITSDLVENRHEYDIMIPELPEGEYSYYIYCQGDVIESGLLYYGTIRQEEIKERERENTIYTYERKN